MLCRFPDFEHTKNTQKIIIRDIILTEFFKVRFQKCLTSVEVSHYFDHLISSAVVITVHQGYANAVFYLSGKRHL